MAVFVGTTPERWLQGLDRVLAATAELMPALPSVGWRRGHVPTRWVLERGSVRAEAPVDVLGGFPGSLGSLNRLQRTEVIATDRYLVIGEGSAGGFALPMADIRAVDLVRPSRQANPGLVIHYQDGPDIGTFAMNFRGLARGLSGRRRAEEVLRVLEDQGIPRMTSSRAPGPQRLSLSWESARRHVAEPLLWSGQARASVGGWYGAVQRSCRVWLTEDSFLWCCSEGNGVNRLPLADIVEVRDGVADRIRVAARDAAGHRYDLAFDFATGTSGVDPMRQRVQLLNALASRGVAISTAPAPLAPWRRGGVVRPTDRGGSGRSAHRYASDATSPDAAVPILPIRRSAS